MSGGSVSISITEQFTEQTQPAHAWAVTHIRRRRSDPPRQSIVNDHVRCLLIAVHPPPAATVAEERSTPEETGNEAHHRQKRLVSAGEYEKTAQYWNIGAQLKLKEHLVRQPNRNIAKNVVFFLGDGMSIPTLAASRMYLGQQQGHTGEESQLSFEEFPDVGLVKVS